MVPLSSVQKTSWYLCLNPVAVCEDRPGQQNSHTRKTLMAELAHTQQTMRENLTDSYVVAHDEMATKFPSGQKPSYGAGLRIINPPVFSSLIFSVKMLRRNRILVMIVKTKYLSLGHALKGDCSRHP